MERAFGQGPLKRWEYLLPLLSGLLMMTAFPPLELGYLAWLALIPLLWFCLKATPRQALAGGLVYGLPLNLYLNLYLAGVLFNHLSPAMAVLAVTLLVLVVSLFNAFFTLMVSYARRTGHALSLTFAIPSLWLLMEYARSLGFIGYNVGYLGYTQWHYQPVLSLASVFGYWGLPFIMVAFQTILVLGFSKFLRGKALAATVAVFALLLLGGTVLPRLAPTEKENTPLWTALIQGNSSSEEILSVNGREKILLRYLEFTRQAVAREPRVKLVIWPETVVDLNLGGGQAHRSEMVLLAQELDVSILYGARVRDRGDLYNSILLLNPDSNQIQVYHKQRLVPFVEYFPLEAFLNKMLDLDVALGRYSAGEEITLFDFSGTPLGGVVCFESYFGDYTRLFANQGGLHLFVLTNDVWFDETIGLEQHAHVSAIRAAEMGTGVTQVANSGITISFDYKGRELLRGGKAEQGIYVLPLDLSRRKTVYTAAGDYFPAFWAFFLVGYLIFSRIRRINKQSRQKSPH